MTSRRITGQPASLLPTGWTLFGGYLIGPTAILPDVDFYQGTASNIDFSDTDLSNADFVQADLANDNFSGANLTDADFNCDFDNCGGAFVSGDDFAGANLTRTVFSGHAYYGVNVGGL